MSDPRHGRVDRVTLGAREITFTVRRTPRRRHVHLVVDDDGVVEVRAPARFALAEAVRLLRQNEPWLLDALARAAYRRRDRPRLVHGALLPFLDRQLRLRIAQGGQLDLLGEPPAEPTKRDGLVRAGGRIWCRGEALHVSPSTLTSGVAELLEAWYRREAGRRLPARAGEIGATLGLQPARVSIRGQRTRWGSCSSRGTVSLNWRLMLVPSRLVDYVVVHELCHLRHMNHSRRFWDLVATRIPDYPSCRDRLQALQATLPL